MVAVLLTFGMSLQFRRGCIANVSEILAASMWLYCYVSEILAASTLAVLLTFQRSLPFRCGCIANVSEILAASMLAVLLTFPGSLLFR
jgi:hypothetical protein